MELKFEEVQWYEDSNLFKSHLYGIEISVSASAEGKEPSLNRTFMELKFRTKNPHSSRSRFKSHLYGIEICGVCSLRVTCQVFKSHLYGIEMRQCYRLQCRDLYV